MAKLTVSQISKAYKNRIVVDNVSMALESKEIVGLLGPNGAGKTTCFYMIVGLIPADSGQVMLEKQNLTELPMYKRARMGIGYLPQEASVFRKLSVADNIMAILQLRKDLDKTQRANMLEQLLAEFNIERIRNNKGMSLSGGERRRVEIARALAIEPNFILLDEPFAGVDPISVIDIKEIIKHLSERGIGVLITDHNVRETLDICHRAYILSQGRMISSGKPREILADQHVRDVYLGEDFYI